jgi:hypothetical protein
MLAHICAICITKVTQLFTRAQVNTPQPPVEEEEELERWDGLA